MYYFTTLVKYLTSTHLVDGLLSLFQFVGYSKDFKLSANLHKENDGGELAFHHKFWNVPSKPNLERTITELAYIPKDIEDGEYVLNLQVAPFENDATPSKPVLYKIK